MCKYFMVHKLGNVAGNKQRTKITRGHIVIKDFNDGRWRRSGRLKCLACKSRARTSLSHGNINVRPQLSCEQNTNPIQRPGSAYLLECKLFSFPASGWPVECFLLADYRWISLDYAYWISDEERIAKAEWGEFFPSSPSRFRERRNCRDISRSVTFKLKRPLSAK